MDHSPFRKLPTELRLDIWEFVLYSPLETGVFDWDDKGPRLAPWMMANNRKALTSVCRQIRADTFPRFYRVDKVSFRPMTLDKFQPGFFVTNSEHKQEMIRGFLGSPGTWAQDLSNWLNHMGDSIRGNIRTINIDIGAWRKTWTAFDNTLLIWLTEALARTVQYFYHYGTTVYLCTLLETHTGFFADNVQLHLPISNMAAVYDILDETIKQKRDKVRRNRYPSLRQKDERALDGCRDMMRTFLKRVDVTIKEQA